MSKEGIGILIHLLDREQLLHIIIIRPIRIELEVNCKIGLVSCLIVVVPQGMFIIPAFIGSLLLQFKNDVFPFHSEPPGANHPTIRSFRGR